MPDWVIPVASLALNVITVVFNYLTSRDKNATECKTIKLNKGTDFLKARWDDAKKDSVDLITAASVERIQAVITAVYSASTGSYEDAEAYDEAQRNSFKLIDDACAEIEALSFKVGIAFKMLNLDSISKDGEKETVDSYVNNVLKLLMSLEDMYCNRNRFDDFLEEFNVNTEAVLRAENKEFNNYVMKCIANFKI